MLYCCVCGVMVFVCVLLINNYDLYVEILVYVIVWCEGVMLWVIKNDEVYFLEF